MKIVQISDLHFTHIRPFRIPFSLKRWAGFCNWLLFRKKECSHKLLDPLPDLFQKLAVDLILVGGDMSTTSLPSEFSTAQQFLQGIFLPKLFIPGNHDQYTGRAFRQKRFYQSFANKRKHLEHRSEFFTLKEHGIEAHQLSDEWWCIALDTAKPTSLFSSNGEFTERHETYLEEMLSLLPPKSSILLFNHFPFFQNDHPKRWLKGGEKLRAFLEKHPEIRLYLHGHTHRHVIADLRESSLPILLDSGCPIQKQSATWNLLNLEKDHCTVTGYRHNGKEWVPFTEQFFSWEKRYG